MTATTDHAEKIIGIGASGLIGTRVSELLAEDYIVTNQSTSTGLDITNTDSLSMLKETNDFTHVILYAAKADVDGCEQDKALGEEGPAWKINVVGAENVARACQQSGKKLILISTDFVFNGDNTPDGGYSEEDAPDPINWYGQTKYDGENAALAVCPDATILRIAYPYRLPFEKKKDFVQAMLGRLRLGQPIRAVTDHVMTPTFVDDIAGAIREVIKQRVTGVYHAVGSEFVSPYDAALTIAEIYSLPTTLIEKTTRDEFFAGRARRPFNLSLKNDKIDRLGVRMRSFRDGLAALHRNSSA